MRRADNGALYIGAWQVQPVLNEISGPEHTTRVEPKVMQVLLRLAEQPGEVVMREQLLDAVWPDVVVTDDVLTRSISELRKAFGDDARDPQVIETIPKAGYRLVAPVTHEEDRAEGEPVLGRSASWLQWPLVMLAGVVVVGLAAVGYWLWQPRAPVLPMGPPEPFTSYPGPEHWPALSPDATRIAFARQDPDGGGWDVYVKLVGADAVLPMAQGPGHAASPTWSPDGRFVAYIRYPEGGGCQIEQVPALGGPVQTVASCGANIYPDLALSPGGAWFAYSDRMTDQEAFRIYLLRPGGRTADAQRHALTDPPPGVWGDHDPTFSPDGTLLAFTRSLSEGQQDVYVVPTDGGSARRLTFDNRNVKGHTWTEDGAALVVASNRSGREQLWRVPVDGGDPTWVPVGDQGITFPTFAAGHLAYRQMSFDTNIWRFDRNPAADTLSVRGTIVASTRWDLHPRLSPDGARLAFTSDRTGTFEVWIARRDGTVPRQLTRMGGPFTGTPRWSPDEQQIVFDSRPDGQADLYIIDTAGGQVQRLTDHPADDLAGSWSRDGARIYFASNRSGRWQVWAMPVDGGAAVPVTQDGGFGPMEGPGGAWLYYTRPDTSGLWRRPSTGGAEERVLDHLAFRDWGNWAVTASGIYYVQRQPLALAYHDFKTGQATLLHRLSTAIPGMDPALDVSADGRLILLGQVDRSESDIMLVRPNSE